MPSFTRLIVVQVAVIFTAVLYNFFTKYFDNTVCSQDPPITLKYDEQQVYSWDDTCQLYSLDYKEARGKFRAATQLYENVETFSFPVAIDSSNEPLTIDVAIFPGNTPEYGTIVHSSGLHGVEGYAGSAIQLALLQKDVLPLSENNRPTIIFLHALNPVGMQEHRRSNENNVDLNRNSIHGNMEDFVNRRDPNNANYDSFRRFLSPTDPDGFFIDPTPWYRTVGIWINLLPQLYKYGFVALKRAMVSGQYHHPRGIFYGGKELQPSLQHIQIFWNQRSDLFRDAPSLVWIDVHTGLGPFGKDSIHYHATSPNGAISRFPQTAAELQNQHFFTSHSVTTSVTQGETSEAFVGYDLTKGMMTSFLAEAYNGSGLFITQEFGTLPAILVGRGLILDNMLYQENIRSKTKPSDGSTTQSVGSGRQDHSYRSPFLLNVFFPQSTTWRASVVRLGVALVVQCLQMSTKANTSSYL
ncbi:DUF2817 domain containing protein [Nitzschia inconspicua]|uniref:DUF2817 domain containing protein n=1 Tax=Nitzschia inconspicua TaxID=303405 RepID=A0A9K3PTH0_9STRA|nr:DUF2817 domain containing protein [Nitzschia inconspicua]